MLDSPTWLTVTTKAAKLDPYVALLDICICIPRLLERTDKLSAPTSPSTPSHTSDIDTLLADAQALANRGLSWFTSFERDGQRYTRVPVSSMPGFSETFSETSTTEEDTSPFTTVYEFQTFGAGICYMIYWMSMLILQSNTFKVLRQFRTLTPQQLFVLDREIGAYADSICRSVPYNCRPATGYTARFGSLTPLVVARKYYEAKKMEKEVKWCERVYKGSRVPGLYEGKVPMEPLKGVQRLVQGSGKFI